MEPAPDPQPNNATPPDKPQQPLASRMKAYEAESDLTLPPNSPIILRLDGHNFSRFTSQSHFDRPFDQRIHSAMLSTTTDLLTYFPQATVAYTQSDEITLVFPSGVQSFNSRAQKLASLAAGYCSVRFNWHLTGCLERQVELRVEGRGVMDEAWRQPFGRDEMFEINGIHSGKLRPMRHESPGLDAYTGSQKPAHWMHAIKQLQVDRLRRAVASLCSRRCLV